MGDRANVYIHEGVRPGVYLYTHWAGTELPALVENALQVPRAQSRNNDGPYLTRILIEEIIGDDRGSETGWGVSTLIGDGEDRIVDVNITDNGPIVTLEGYEYDDEDWYVCTCFDEDYNDEDDDY